jgi:methyl coenzyme M reductase beta subunit
MVQRIRLSEKVGKSLVSRRSASALREIIRESKLNVIVDFEGVERLAYEFAVEAFGKLASVWGTERFHKIVTFTNISASDHKTIVLVVEEAVKNPAT